MGPLDLVYHALPSHSQGTRTCIDRSCQQPSCEQLLRACHPCNGSVHLTRTNEDHRAWQVIEPLRSRCLCIRVAAPSLGEVQHVLAVVAKREGLALPEELGARIAKARG